MSEETMSEEVAEQDDLSSLVASTEALLRAIGDETSGLGSQAEAVLERLRDRRFDVAIVGEFNRGKSTLLNMLIDRMVLPAGILPVTAAVTELTYGEQDNARVNFSDGSQEIIDLNQLETFISEESNPGNSRNVENVQISLPSPVLRHGAVLVDTPGVGSIFRHNSEMAREVIDRADAAIVVLSADTPITDAERSLIRALSKRSQKTFFVLNRIDHLDEADREKIKWFVENVLNEAFGGQQTLWLLSAKTREGFDEFAAAVEEFLSNELDSARANLARRDVATLADMVDNDCSLEESALTMSAADIDDKLSHFRRSINWQNEAFSDDTVIFQNATKRISDALGERLVPVARADEAARERLRAATREASNRDLPAVIERALQAEIHSAVEPVRRREELEVERSWTRAAERYERATQRRAEKLHEVASDLFQVDLKPIELVQPSNQRGRFFYSSPDIEAIKETSIGTLLTSVFMPKRRRRQMLETAHQRFAKELKRHMDRLHDDLAARVSDADETLERSMSERVTQLGVAMTGAIERGQSRRNSTEEEQRRQHERAQQLRDAATAARSTAETSQGAVAV